MNQLKNGYYSRLTTGQRIFYDRLIGEIMAHIDEEGLDKYNAPLEETYLPGYYLQRNALDPKTNGTNKVEES